MAVIFKMFESGGKANTNMAIKDLLQVSSQFTLKYLKYGWENESPYWGN